jgi:DNA-binding NtrC family response regulator
MEEKLDSIKIIHVEDDPIFYLSIKKILGKENEIFHFKNIKSLRKYLETTELKAWDISIIDIDLKDDEENGLVAIELLKGKTQECFVLSAMEEDKIIEAAYAGGANHFLSKDCYLSTIPNLVNVYKIKHHREDLLKETLSRNFITRNKELVLQLENLLQIHFFHQNLVILGETGVGKTQLAKTIHHLQLGKKYPFVHLNCAEIPDSLFESELFGHKKGSFTGATEDYQGKLVQASGGTLFLDEIGNMPISTQKKLLKAIEEKEFYPVGSSQLVKVNFRLISATSENLIKKIALNEFREDLYFRIAHYIINIKALRDRPEDIPPLVTFFTNHQGRRVIIKKEAMEMLCNYSFPGNIREMKNLCYSLALEPSGIISESVIKSKNLLNGLFEKMENVKIESDSKKEFDESIDYISESQIAVIKKEGLSFLISKIEKKAIEIIAKEYPQNITKAIETLKISTGRYYRILKDV